MSKREFFRKSDTAHTAIKIVLIVLLILLLIAVFLFFYLQRYIIYTDNGVRLDIPILRSYRAAQEVSSLNPIVSNAT